MSAPLLSVEALNVWFAPSTGEPHHAVRDVSFDVAAGERMALVGESGCGKTTTLMSVLGLLPPTATVSGAARFGGEDLLAGGERGVRPHRWRDVAVVFQGAMGCFNPVLDVGTQIAEPLVRAGTKRRLARARAGELLERVGVGADHVRAYPHELSGGMRQRAAIAMALVQEPKVVLADEPTTALDVIVQAQVMELLTALCRELDLGLVLVTHDLAVVAAFCDHAAVMRRGEIVERGPVGTLLTAPEHPYTRELVDASRACAGGAPLPEAAA